MAVRGARAGQDQVQDMLVWVCEASAVAWCLCATIDCDRITVYSI